MTELRPGDKVWVKAVVEEGLGLGLIRLPEPFTSPEEPGIGFLQEVSPADVMPDAELASRDQRIWELEAGLSGAKLALEAGSAGAGFSILAAVLGGEEKG